MQKRDSEEITATLKNVPWVFRGGEEGREEGEREEKKKRWK